MSVTFSLYRVRDDVDYKGHPIYDILKAKEADMLIDNYDGLDTEIKRKVEALGYRNDYDPDYEEKINDIWDRMSYSDGIRHEYLDITGLSMAYKGHRGYGRLMAPINRLHAKTVKVSGGERTMKYVVVDTIAYSQGWFLKKRFFKKGITSFYAVRREDMENFFKRYVQSNLDSRDKLRGDETVKRFLDTWKPGMDGILFECAY